jgi:hypothetical protein
LVAVVLVHKELTDLPQEVQVVAAEVQVLHQLLGLQYLQLNQAKHKF